MEDTMERLEKLATYVTVGIEKQDPTVIGILVACLVVFLSILLFLIFGRSSNKRSGVLILGICDAGKTLLFNRIVNGSYKQTYSSMAANSNYYVVPVKNKKLRVLDLPGYDRIRTAILDENKSLARGIIYVVDCSSVMKEIKEVAEYLYSVLSDETISNNSPPMLIACNKQDMATAKGAKVVKTQLEKEINTLRVTRGAALQGQDNTANNNSYLGKRNKDFEFTDLKPMSVEFVECICGKDEDTSFDLDEVKQWLNTIA